jgi:error-prone DNA polymerase
MGFYPADALAHEAQRREGAEHHVELLPPDVNSSEVACAMEGGAVRLGLAYVTGARADEVASLIAERERGGPYRSTGDLASRAGAGRPALECLDWAGACDALAGGRRAALWELGVATPGDRLKDTGTQLALPYESRRPSCGP